MRTDTPQTIHLRDYAPPPYLIDEVELHFTLSPEAARVTSRLHMRPNPACTDDKAELELDGDELTLNRLAIEGRELTAGEFDRTDKQLIVREVPQTPFVVETDVTINPKANTTLSGLYLSNGVYSTQCEAEGFRRITYFLDRPDVLSTYRVKITADKDKLPILLSNGNLTASGDDFSEWHDPFPKPSYLFALVAGDLPDVKDTFGTMTGR